MIDMDENLPAQELLKMSGKDLQERFDSAERRWEKFSARSSSARSKFNEKLAILAAGSLALLGTAATTLYNKPFPAAFVNHQVLQAVVIAAVCLWMSMCLCIFHNLVNSYALEKEEEMHISETLVIERARATALRSDQSDDYKRAHRGWDKRFSNVRRFHAIQRKLSMAAFVLFAAGYSEIVWMIIQIARNVP
jgi:hypothetical protein